MLRPELWKEIELFEVGNLAGHLAFVDCLADENGWTLEYAKGAVQEYRKFAYLAAISSDDVIPSAEVEQVWRMHLTYTRNYWESFCGMLGKSLHRDPVIRNQIEDSRREAQYENTMLLYESEFGALPTPGYWPKTGERFSGGEKFVRVDVAANLVLQKPTAALWRSAARFAGVAAFPLIVVGYAVTQTSSPPDDVLTSKGWIMVAGIAVMIAVFGCLVWRMEFRTKKQMDRTH